jgi:hypothetical protein
MPASDNSSNTARFDVTWRDHHEPRCRPEHSPGTAFADLDHLAGTEIFSRLCERYERD